MENTASRETVVTCKTHEGVEVRATILRLTRYLASFEIYDPTSMLQASEVLDEFKILLNGRLVYDGRAVVSNLVNAGTVLICEATLQESWIDIQTASLENKAYLRAEFGEFMRQWEKNYKVLPDFKVVVADMQSMLADMRLWLGQVELGVMSHPPERRAQLEHDVIQELSGPILPSLGMLFEKFEESCRAIEPDLKPAHRAYVQRQLHPLVLASPFMNRTFQKPLGYAGDYEMVAMMMRDPQEGASLFAKSLNTFFLNTPPVVAHVNRIEYLKTILVQETARVVRAGRVAKIFNLGCGPAKEIQDFIAMSDLSGKAHFTLLDFNPETLQSTGANLTGLINKYHRATQLQMVKKSVAQVLKEAGKATSTVLSSGYDLVYCAGLFDYMPEFVCQQLMAMFYRMLAPGGLLVATNVHTSNPSRGWMELCVDWHLIYRDNRQMVKLVPEAAPADSHTVLSEPTGVNTFVEIRKPDHV
ncbi:MAG: hypothetical protein JWR69_4313 [Pedosphaera sp.]|nr:hypothetical protein [Pedosphaera sp.]